MTVAGHHNYPHCMTLCALILVDKSYTLSNCPSNQDQLIYILIYTIYNVPSDLISQDPLQQQHTYHNITIMLVRLEQRWQARPGAGLVDISLWGIVYIHCKQCANYSFLVPIITQEIIFYYQNYQGRNEKWYNHFNPGCSVA